ncbi:hypothetical protein Lal_00010764, partial [Lupinus albus]
VLETISIDYFLAHDNDPIELGDGEDEVSRRTKWMANMTLVPKKGGELRMCVNYTNLNKSSLK